MRNIGEHKIGRDGSNLVQSRFAKLTLYVVFSGKTEPTMGLQCGIRRLPRGVSGQQLCHVGFGSTRSIAIKEFGRSETHQVGSLNIDVCLGNRKLHSLVLTNGPPKYDTLVGILYRSLDKPVPIAERLGRDQNAFGIQAVEQIAKPFSFLSDELFKGNMEVVEEHLRCMMIDHGADRLDSHSSSNRIS